MDIISQTQDGATWHFKIGNLASDGIYRVADLSRETANPADWLAANEAEAQNAIDVGGVTLEHSEAQGFTGLPDWAAYTTAEVVAFIHDAILAGDTLTQAQAKIDALPSTVAGMKTGLKAVAAELITVRGILEKMAKAVVYLRDRT